MCASCVAQGVTYVGGSVGVLRVMAWRASRRRINAPAFGALERNTSVDEADEPVAST